VSVTPFITTTIFRADLKGDPEYDGYLVFYRPLAHAAIKAMHLDQAREELTT
jgi:hypothetical protein